MTEEQAQTTTCSDGVASPCIGVCRLDGATALCVGCLRTGSEIGAWREADNALRRLILDRIRARRSAAALPIAIELGVPSGTG